MMVTVRTGDEAACALKYRTDGFLGDDGNI